MPSNPQLRAPISTTVYFGLGSNLGDRRGAIAAAVAGLGREGVATDLVISQLYESVAIADEPQPPYLNAVARGETALRPEAVLAGCLAIEAALGRVRPAGRSKAARTIDIDLLLYGTSVIDLPQLHVPHPALLSRAFVLIPLAEVAREGLIHPATRSPLTKAAASDDVRLWHD